MKKITNPPSEIISRKDAAKYLGLKPKTLACWNSSGKHDEFFSKIHVGGRIFYDFQKVNEFIKRA